MHGRVQPPREPPNERRKRRLLIYVAIVCAILALVPTYFAQTIIHHGPPWNRHMLAIWAGAGLTLPMLAVYLFFKAKWPEFLRKSGSGYLLLGCALLGFLETAVAIFGLFHHH